MAVYGRQQIMDDVLLYLLERDKGKDNVPNIIFCFEVNSQEPLSYSMFKIPLSRHRLEESNMAFCLWLWGWWEEEQKNPGQEFRPTLF